MAMGAEFDRQAQEMPHPGSIVTYLRRNAPADTPFASGVVVGPVVPDPATGRWWIGVRLPHGTAPSGQDVDWIAVESIVDTIPPYRQDQIS